MTVHPPSFEFPLGLPAFEDEKRFLLIERAEFSPLVLLQSAVRPELRFVCAPPSILDPDYSFEISDEDQALLGQGPCQCLAILTFPSAGIPTANLMAPVVICHSTGRGMQIIQTLSSYSHCHPLRPSETPCQ